MRQRRFRCRFNVKFPSRISFLSFSNPSCRLYIPIQGRRLRGNMRRSSPSNI